MTSERTKDERAKKEKKRLEKEMARMNEQCVATRPPPFPLLYLLRFLLSSVSFPLSFPSLASNL